jgi:U3 small nucleolar RNA-associated protein 19
MPSASKGGTGTRKRKVAQVSAIIPPAKRARSESSESEDDEDGLAEIHRLETEILASRKNYNNITTLIKKVRSPDDGSQGAYNAAVALTRVFLNLLAGGNLTRKAGSSEKDLIVVEWLKDRLGEFKEALLALIKREDDFSVAALTICMKILKSEAMHLSEKVDYIFPHAFFGEIVKGVFEAGVDETREKFVDNFVNQYEDIRFYVFKAIR